MSKKKATKSGDVKATKSGKRIVSKDAALAVEAVDVPEVPETAVETVENNSSETENSGSYPAENVVSFPTSNSSATADNNETERVGDVMNLTLDTKVRKGNGVVYSIAGVARGQVYFPRSVFEGEPPATMDLTGASFRTGPAAKAAKVKLTAEERAAAKAAETPEQKAAKIQKRIDNANKALAALQATPVAEPVTA